MISPDRRDPSEIDWDERRRQREERMRLRNTPEGILAEGFREAEIPLVQMLRAKRAEWRVYGVEGETIVNDVMQKWKVDFEAVEAEKQSPKQIASYRGFRPLWGSTLERPPFPFYDEFSPNDQFSVDNLVSEIESRLSQLKKPNVQIM